VRLRCFPICRDFSLIALVSHSAPLSFYLLVFCLLTSVQAQAALSIAMLGDLSGGLLGYYT